MITVSIIETEISYGIDLSSQGAEVLTITQEEFQKIQSGLSFFNLTTKTVEDLPPVILPEPEPTIPTTLTPRQIRLALLKSGINLGEIESMISLMKEPERSEIQVMREYSGTYERNDPILKQFAEQLQLSEEQVDQIFIFGANI